MNMQLFVLMRTIPGISFRQINRCVWLDPGIILFFKQTDSFVPINIPLMKGSTEMKAVVNRDTCIGCGLCESLCPDVFNMDTQNIATVAFEVIPAASEACTKEAMEGCPVAAISVE